MGKCLINANTLYSSWWQIFKHPFGLSQLQCASCGPVARWSMQPVFYEMLLGSSEIENRRKLSVFVQFKHYRLALYWTLFWRQELQGREAVILKNSIPNLFHLGCTDTQVWGHSGGWHDSMVWECCGSKGSGGGRLLIFMGGGPGGRSSPSAGLTRLSSFVVASWADCSCALWLPNLGVE